MRLPETLGVLVLVTLTQIWRTQAQECNIISVNSPTASSLLIQWNRLLGITNYFLDLRAVNDASINPTVVLIPENVSKKEIFGLRPGTLYTVILKGFLYYTSMCVDVKVARTAPATSQITYSKAISSTSIKLEWDWVQTATKYHLLINSTLAGEQYNISFTNNHTLVENLRPATAYDCYVVTSNSGGLGARSKVRTITTLTQPPAVITLQQTGPQSLHISWQAVDKVLVYLVTVRNLNNTIFSNRVFSTTLNLQNIAPCSSYLISVSSVNALLEPGEPREVNYSTNTLSAVTSISVDYSCATSSAVVSWAPVFGATSYRASAVSQKGTVRSCTSSIAECQLSQLNCGESFEVHVTAMSNNCESTESTSTSFETVTCPPSDLMLYRECSSNVIIFSWAPNNNSAYYLAQAVDSNGKTMKCMTTDSSCFFTDTTCGRLYNFTVYGSSMIVSEQCDSAVSPVMQIRTAPCQPRYMETTTNCELDVLTSTWDSAEGALGYRVDVFGNRGNHSQYVCHSTTESCNITGVHCGESLTMLLTAFDDECSSSLALGEVAQTVPCAPQNVSAMMDCGSDSISLTWNVGLGASYYIATATDELGNIHTCNSIDQHCKITGLRCGALYSAYVIASNSICNSSVSETITAETAPCPPEDVQALLDCQENQAVVSWLGSRSMISFTATLEDLVGGHLSCNTTASSCQIPNLKCGQVYAVSVTHHDGVCPSMPSHPIYLKSIPCGPANVHAEVQCPSGVLSMGWDTTEDVVGYTTSVVSVSSGEQVYCNSTLAACSLSGLQCGQSYSIQVRSYNGTCLSMPTESLVIREAPCVPTDVVARRICGNGSVEVSWSASLGAQSYVAVAVGESGHRTECSSDTTTCSFSTMQCSSVYSISVWAVDGNCSSLESQSITLRTVSCSPTNIQSSLNCSTNSISVSWDASVNALSYEGTAVARDGHTLTCNSSSPWCQFNGLHCGQEYVFIITASDGTCESPNSQEHRHETAPCAPQSVSSFLNCASNSLNVSWVMGGTALNYSVLARSAGGAALSCTTGTSNCIITGLQCGQNYTSVVTADNGECQGPASNTNSVQTVPCVPASVHADVECVSNTVRASWGLAAGALSYTSVLSGPGNYSETCMTSDLSCSFRGLTCAQTYTLNIISHDSQCDSLASPDVSVKTAPCDPEAVSATLFCDSRTVSVSWQASAGSSMYTVLAHTQNQSIPSSSCHTLATSCDLPELHCGEVFNITVLGNDGTCNSSVRASTTLETAPCAPLMRYPLLNCSSNSALMSWAENPDSLSVHVNAVTAMGHTAFCNSSTQSCSLESLLCGQSYSVHGTAQGSQCASTPSAPFNIITAPCTPSTLSADYTCGTSTALLSWEESLGRESFYLRAETDGHSDFCSTNQTHCSVNTLRCGRLYNVSVESVSSQCNSSNAAHMQLQTAPCAPQNVTVSLQCSRNTASVSWVGSPGAVGYNVTALGPEGDVRHSYVNDTNCQLSNMHCAQTYNIVVIPFSDTCAGFPSAPYTFIAGPCPPTNVEVSLQCNGNLGIVRWTATQNAEMYIATATSEDGHAHTCISNDTTCNFNDLHCEENYSVTVVTVERGCQSEPSSAVNLRSAICPPSNLAGLTNCANNDITISWNPSPMSGVTYFLYSQQMDGLNSTFSTTQTSHFLSGLQCGMSFTVQIAAEDSVCRSQYGNPVQVHTAPCPPSSLEASASCGTNKGTISWQAGAGASSYTANVVGNNGHTVSCTSTNTTCIVKLECGQRYTATVVSSVGLCNSTVNNNIQFDSAPCLPGNVVANLDCNVNNIAVQWDHSESIPDSYTALAIAGDGTRFSCNTSSTSCTMLNVRCGRTYSIVVTTSNISCGIIEGSDYRIQTAPCKPETPSVQLQCASNVAEVTWNNDGAEQFDMVTALNLSGGMTTCNSTNASCTFTQLSCGESYTLSVTGYTENCTSVPSTTLNLDTAPCVPTFVVATTDCDASITTVRWDPARGASRYTVLAMSTSAHRTTCTNTDTTCAFSDLQCGQNYTITVTAEDEKCVSLTSVPMTITTGPCPHGDLRATTNCGSNSAQISWMPGNGTLMYNASAEINFDNGQTVSCNTSGSSCSITDLQCGSSYKIGVSGQGLTCPSQSNEWITLQTEPCPPTNLSIQSSCDSDTVSISWDASKGSVEYMAVAESREGHRLTCNTTEMICDVIGLQCGQTYEVYVSGVDGNCIGTRSEVQILETAPCVPHDVQGILECQSTVLNVTWQQRGHADHYHATVKSNHGQLMGCDSNQTFCQIPNILCGLMYSVEVVAYSESCNSSNSSVQYVMSAPCPPEEITAIVGCDLNTVSISWDSSVDGVLYIAKAFYSDNAQDYFTCNTTGTSCDITVSCGMTLNITVEPLQNGCIGANAPIQHVRTGPCLPVMLDVEMDCLSDSAWLTWEESAGAELYIAMAIDSDGQLYQCNSTEGQCTVEQLQCSKFYNFSVIASNNQCDSLNSNAVRSETAPCPPQNVVTSVDCNSGAVNVTWDESVGALRYTATLEHADGETTCCTAESTFCEVTSLPCGQLYVLTVTAEGRTCNSSQSTEVIVRSVPCVPEGLMSNTSCNDNVATMTWVSKEAGELYTVTAFSADGLFYDSCSGFSQTCDLMMLKCGVPYTATVIAQDSICTSPPSAAASIRTVPCVPEYVSANVSCQENALTTFWQESEGADMYTATLMGSNGHSTTCQSMNDTTCTVSGLACGEIYRVSVVASDGYCDSQPSALIDTHSVPCMPRNIHAVVDCQSGAAILSWQPGGGAMQYTATALSQSGHALSCESNETNCELADLACGESYNVTVLTQGQTCSSSATMRGHLMTGPCVPQNVVVEYSPSIGQLSWDGTTGASTYTAQAVTDLGSVLSCSTGDTFCSIYNMTCSQIYDITVTAQNDVCQDVAVSVSATLETDPCPPQNVDIHLNCSNDEGVVSWEESIGALAYSAFIEGHNGHSVSCYTTGSTCIVTGLMCGTIYHTQVQAIGRTYNSTDSETVIIASAPCPPDSSSITVDLNCDNATAMVSWDLSDGAISYELTATSGDGHFASCISEENYCNISELACGQTYAVSLTAINDQCSVTHATDVTFQTSPCAPLRVDVELQCQTGTAIIIWEQRDNVLYYLASANLSTGEVTTVCNSTSDRCEMTGLQCGEEYAFTVTAYNELCHSDISSAVHIHTGPCQPAQPNIVGSCDNSTVLLNLDASKGASSYMVHVSGNLGYTDSFQTSESSLELDLLCGQTYTFTTVGQNDQCDSTESSPVDFTTAPCVPYQVETFAQCESNLAAVSWAASDGADNYTAIAVGQDGHTHVCVTNTTNCIWNDLHCGEIYTVHVIASSDACSTAPSNSTTIHMAPCIPQNLSSAFDCQLKVVSLTWETNETAELYLVSAEAPTGHRVELSASNTSAQISEFSCGQQYFVTVIAVDQMCRSHPSNVLIVQTEPCIPASVFGFMDCISNIATVSWEPADGAEFYTATVQGPDGPLGTCMSWSVSCGMPKLSCGESYNVSVIASSRQCNSTPSALSTFNTVPCIPMDVSVVMDCDTAEAHVSWNASNGALYYTAYAWSQTFDFLSCTSNGTDTHCILSNLNCGDEYTVQVVAEGHECSSLPSQATYFHTVPCAPVITEAHLDCNTDSIVLHWTQIESSISYTAEASTPGGLISTCSSNNTHCQLTGLTCGQTYSVKMVSYDGVCHSTKGTALNVSSVPCPPQDVESTLLCSSNSAHVQWNASGGAESYEVHAISTDGHLTGCDSTNTSCVVSDLICGSLYDISVVALGYNCNVSRSTITKLQSVPCVPDQPVANIDCASGEVDVSWQSSPGALMYTAVAHGNGGFESTCSSNSTVCKFPSLLCGLTYSISVTASDHACTSVQSHSVLLDTVPCEPQGIVAEMECRSHVGVVSWEHETAIVSYIVHASSSYGDEINVGAPANSIRLPNMHCGQAYNVTITAQDSQCDSHSAFLKLNSVPCPPDNVQASLICPSNSAAVTWQSARGALFYQAEGITVDGNHTVYCNGSETQCELKHLLCGRTYNVSALSMDDMCSSEESASTQVHTAPCPPEAVRVQMDCSSGLMTVTWAANPDAQLFHVTANNGSSSLSCESTSTSCSISGLPCGESYSVTVTAVKDNCESQPSTAVSVSSAPCVPQGEAGILDCVANSAWVSWLQAQGAESYVVLAVERGGANSSCSTTAQHCNVPDLMCGATYTLHVTAVNSFCQSGPSNTFQIQTAPCALTSINAHTDCNNSKITVNWQLNEGSSMYVATAEGHDLSILVCNSTGTSCDLTGVQCGMQYTILVSASSDKCSSMRSPPYKINTAPCVPQNVSLEPVCDSSGMQASWSHSVVAETYSLVATGRDGDIRTCTSTTNNCTLSDLHCGQFYNVSVTASAGNCISQSSQRITFHTVPCEPQDLSVAVQCDTGTATLSWAESQESLKYIALAQTNDGHVLHCDTNGTSCTIQGLTCGTVYNFSAQASDGTCNGSLSVPIEKGAVPCPPANVRIRTHAMGDTTLLMTSWSSVSCPDVSYQVKVSGDIQNNPQMLMDMSSYWTDRSFFEFPVPCSTSFKVDIQSQNSAGSSRPSQTVPGVTVPCPPMNVTFTGDNLSATVTWMSSVLSTEYTVYKFTSEGRVAVCHTSNLSCQVSGVLGSDVGVTARNSAGESIASRIVSGSNRRKRDLRGAKVLAGVTAGKLSIPEVLVTHGEGLSLQIQWSPVMGATSYTMILSEGNPSNDRKEVLYIPDQTSTVLPGLKPDTQYCVMLSAKNSNHQSAYSKAECVTTGVSA